MKYIMHIEKNKNNIQISMHILAMFSSELL